MQRGHLVKDLLVRHLPALLRADELAHGVHPPLQLRGAEPPPIVDDALDDGEQLAPGRHSLRESGARERDGGAEGAGPHVLDEPHRALDDGAGVGAEAHRVAGRDAECELLPSAGSSDLLAFTSCREMRWLFREAGTGGGLAENGMKACSIIRGDLAYLEGVRAWKRGAGDDARLYVASHPVFNFLLHAADKRVERFVIERVVEDLREERERSS